MNQDILRVPSTFTMTEVVQALEGVCKYRAAVRWMKRINAISNAKCKPMQISARILKKKNRTVFDRCLENYIERRMKGML